MSELKELLWVERFRPVRLVDLVDQEGVKVGLMEFVRRGDLPHLLFYGPPGVGKTTAALALARELYGDSWRSSVLELNASDERGIDVIREKVKEFARTIPTGPVPFKLVILDEADNMTSDAQQALRRIMEMYASTTRFILLANYISGIIEPIQSRCAIFRFNPLPKEAVIERLRQIAKETGVEVTEDGLEAIWEVSQGDMRKAINTLQTTTTTNKKVDREAVYRVVGRVEFKVVDEFIESALSGRFEDSRKLLRNIMYTYGVSGVELLKYIEDELLINDKFKLPVDAKVEVSELVADIDNRLVTGSDEEIQLTALIAKLALIGSKYGLRTVKEPESKPSEKPVKRGLRK
ncbi:replication factor C small subunit [Caldivirga maquilingensis]|uniref:Replication factor C small subunit n=1 Tax=Caldivirga maquilingensis (strain ATCC 700844 / DSM 13496 / JCM 10307 / IC-167) TaxID=397948 RepID=A8MD96_CALMQ|nr:replication factor C small subunit [Caldivirga maquilingensis]ABW01752.1 Replication factor C [Caldivirga maquilingensis IC-167]